MKMLDFYRSILKMAAAEADSEGNLNLVVEGNKKHYKLDGRRLVLPTPLQLSLPDWSERFGFHPLQENALRGESKVLTQYRRDVNVWMNYVLTELGQQLLSLAAHTAAHSRLNPNQTPLLNALAEADDKTLDAYAKLRAAMGLGNASRSWINLYLSPDALIGGKRYNRGCLVGFPLRDALLNDSEKQVFGVTLTKKQRATILALVDFILPPDVVYSTGTYSSVAPSLHALLGAVLKVGERVNRILDNYTEFLDHGKNLRYPDEWVEVYQDFASMQDEINMVQMLPGNEGGLAPRAGTTAAAPAAAAPVHQPGVTMPAHAVPPPRQAAAAAPRAGEDGIVRHPDGSIDMAATMRAKNGGHMPYPSGPAYLPPSPQSDRMAQPRWANTSPGYGAYPQQQPMYPQQGYGMGYPQQQPPGYGYGTPGTLV